MTLNGKIDKSSLLRKCNIADQNNHRIKPQDLSEGDLVILLGKLWSKYTPAMLKCEGGSRPEKRPTRSSQFVSDGGGDSFLRSV